VGIEFYKPDRVTFSRVVSGQPCYISTLVVTGKGGGTGILTIRNGFTNVDEVLSKINVAVAESRVFNFNNGLYLSRGLYLELNDYIEEVLVLYKEI